VAIVTVVRPTATGPRSKLQIVSRAKHIPLSTMADDSATAFASSLAGGLASVMSLSLTYPLDQLRTVQQAKGTSIGESFSTLYGTDGWKGFYKGLSSGLVAMGLSWATYYYFFSLFQLRARLQFGSKTLSDFTNLRIATQAGVIVCVLMEPVWVVNTRQKLAAKADPDDPGLSILGQLLHLLRTEGIAKLYGGILPSLLLVTNPALQFMTAEWLRQIPALCDKNFLLGALSKLVSTVITYPIQTVKTKLQKSSTKPVDPPRERTFSKLLLVEDQQQTSPVGGGGPPASPPVHHKRTLLEQFLRLYRGMSVKMVGTVLTSAFMFLFHSILVRITLPLIMRLRQRGIKS